MQTSASTSAITDGNGIIARAIIARFSSRPTLRSQTSRLLKDGLLEKYPHLDFDPDRTKLAQPIPNGAWRLTLLLDVVLEYLATGASVDFAEHFGRDCFLTNRIPAQLSVGKTTSRLPAMPVIAEVVRELPGFLPISLQESLTAYWNENDEAGSSRWQWLGNLLAGVLRTAATRLSASNASHADILTELCNQPDKQQRHQHPWPKGLIQTFTLQTTLTRGGASSTLQTPDILVICGETHLLCSATGRVESFPSLEAFGQAWGTRFQDFKADSIIWKRYEPDGNAFDTQAALLLSQQLDDLSALQLPASQSLHELEQRVAAITDVAALFTGPQVEAPHLHSIQATLPEWLKGATATDRMAYRKHVLAMAGVKQQTQGRSFHDGIDDLRTFAKKALHEQMLKDQPQAPGYDADQLELTFHIAVGDLGSGYVETVNMSLTDLAIKNLAGKPKGRMTVRHTGGQLIQDWTTEAYLLDLVSRVDVGKQYPEHIKNLLLGESAEAAERARLFGLELSIRLPMLALESSIKGEHGFTHQGYQYVDALMNPAAAEQVVDEQSIVIRPLAFQRKAGADSDVVSNMFIIEPKDLRADGPHILYQPQYSPPLRQFSTRKDLLRSIAQAGPLQTSVLSWLPDRARPIYDNNGFNEPHIVHFHAGDEFGIPEKPKPAILAGDEAAGDWLRAVVDGRLLARLFDSNARALVDLADRQSVSNAESRWAIILEGGWLIFNNLILPLLRGPAMLVGWMLQITYSLINDLPALDSDDPVARNAAWTDVLLNIGLLLLHGARDGLEVRSPDRRQTLPVALESWRRSPGQSSLAFEAPITEDTPGLPSEPPGSGHTLLDFNLSTARDASSIRLFEMLQDVRVPWPATLPEPLATGPFKGLYLIKDVWYASVKGLFFRVSIVAGFGEVYLVHPEHPDRPGIKLKSNGHGHWTLDQGLKLVGGGPKSRIAAERERRQQRIALLKLNRTQFTEQQRQVQKRVDFAESMMTQKNNNPASSEEDRATFRQLFVGKLDEQTETYIRLFGETRELCTLTGNPPADTFLCGLLENLINNTRKRIVIADLDREALNRKYATFSNGIEHVYAALQVEGVAVMDRYFEFMRKTFEINEVMIKGYEDVDSWLLDLKKNSRLGAESWQRLTSNRTDNELGALRVKSYQLLVLRILSPKELAFETTMALESTVNPLVLLSRSHVELQDSNAYQSDDRIAVLDSLVDHYNKAQDGLETIGIFNTEELETQFFNRLREIVEELRVDAERRLAEELQNVPQFDEPAPPSSGPSRPPVTSRKKVIRTTKGTLIGDIRPRIANQGGDIVDVNGPLENRPLASFHEHEPNNWVEIVEPQPPAPAAPSRAYPQLKGDARKALGKVDQQVKRIEGYAQHASSPKEIEEQLQREALKLTAYADRLEHHENPGTHPEQDASLISGLRDKAITLNTKATELRTRMTLAQAPTSEGVEFLLRRKEIFPDVLGERIQLKTGRKDFMQEYVLLNSADEPWWYAHFHYARLDDLKSDYTRAHLKTKEQRFETYESALAKATDSKQKIDVHHGFISKELADSYFLSLQPR